MMMKVDAIIAIPFCEKEYDMLLDTIDSIRYHCQEKYHIIAIDDFSKSGLDQKLRTEIPEITVLRNKKNHGGRSGLYITVAEACKYAIANFDFKVFIKMDTDALMTGPSLISMATEKFSSEPNLGLLGSYKVRADGVKRNWNMWKLVMLYESSYIRKLSGKPVLWKSIIKDANRRNYNLAENVLGGCYILSEPCIKAMFEKGYLDYEYNNVLTQSKLGEDVIYGLYCKASGFDIADLGRPGDPMAIALDTLPILKEKIISAKVAVVHSIKKGLQGENQEELRNFFKNHRIPKNNH